MSNEISGPSFIETVELPDGRKVLLLSDIHMDCLGCDVKSNVAEVDNSLIHNRLKKLFEAEPTKQYDVYLEIGDRNYPFIGLRPQTSQISSIVQNANKHSSLDYSGYLSKTIKTFGSCFNSDIIQKKQVVSQSTSIYDVNNCHPNVKYHAINVRHLYDSANIREDYMKDIPKFRKDFKDIVFKNVEVNSRLAGPNTLFQEIKRLYQQFTLVDQQKAKLLEAITLNRFKNIDQSIATTTNPKRFDLNEGAIIFDLYTCLLIEERIGSYTPTNIIIYAGANHIYYIKEYFLLYTKRVSLKHTPTTNYVLLYDLLLHYANTPKYVNPLEYNVSSFQSDIRTEVSSFITLIMSNVYSRCINDFDMLSFFGVQNDESPTLKNYDLDLSDRKLIVLENGVEHSETQIGNYNVRIFTDDNTNVITIMNKIGSDDHVMFEYLGDTNLLNRIGCLAKRRINDDNTIKVEQNSNATVFDSIFQLLSSFEQNKETDQSFRGNAKKYTFKGDLYTFKGPCIYFQSSFGKTIKDKYNRDLYYVHTCEVANYDNNSLRHKVQLKLYNNSLVLSSYRNGRLRTLYNDHRSSQILTENPHLLRSIYPKVQPSTRQRQVVETQNAIQSPTYINDKLYDNAYKAPMVISPTEYQQNDNVIQKLKMSMKSDIQTDDDYYLKNQQKFYGGNIYRADIEDLLFENGKSTKDEIRQTPSSILVKRGYLNTDVEQKYYNKSLKSDSYKMNRVKDQTYDDTAIDESD